MNFFKSKAKTPPELIRSIKEAIVRLDSSNSGAEGRRKVRRPILEVLGGLLI